LLKVTKTSLDFVWSEEAIIETNNKLSDKSLFIDESGKLIFSASSLVNKIICKQLTED